MRKVEGLYVNLCERSFHFCIIGTDRCFRNMDNGATEPAVVVLPSDTINLNQTSQPLQPSSSLTAITNTFSETFKTVWPPSMDSPIPRLGSLGYTMDQQPELDQETDVSSTMDPRTIPRPYSRSQQLMDFYGPLPEEPLPVEVVLHILIKTHYSKTDCSWRRLWSQARSLDSRC